MQQEQMVKLVERHAGVPNSGLGVGGVQVDGVLGERVAEGGVVQGKDGVQVWVDKAPPHAVVRDRLSMHISYL